MGTYVGQLKTVFADSFMKPQCFRGADIQSEIMDAGLDLEDDGIYCRLSAPGYLDCTDWSGPFETVEEAAEALIDLYGGETANEPYREAPTPFALPSAARIR